MLADTRVRRYGRVTLVDVVVENDGRRPRRVRVTSELDGPVWPPRREGVPEAGWDGGEFSTRLDPGERRSLGFASPADPVDPPVSVDADAPTTDGGSAVTPGALVRTLGDPRPPGDAVGRPTARTGDEPGTTAGTGAGTGTRARGPASDGPSGSRPSGRNGGEEGATEAGNRDGTGDAAERREGVGPQGAPAVRAWLAALEANVDPDPDAAGVPATRPDPAVLRAVADRAGALADRLEATADPDGDGNGDAGGHP